MANYKCKSVGIIGSGIQGVCTGLQLIKKGIPVTIFDRHDPLSKEFKAASYGNAGHFSPYAVLQFKYDPNRNANIALLLYIDGERRYIIAPKNLKTGDSVMSGKNSSITVGNSLPMENIPVGTQVHCIEMKPGKGAQIARSAGTVAQIAAIEGEYVTVKLRSGEMRKIFSKCKATIGEVGNSEYSLQSHGKAGAKRWLGIRPTVRGVAMNPIDHPHGGGEGKTSGGRHPVSPWGTPTKGYKTRSNKRTNNMIVRRRSNKKRK